ncbi:MAG: dipeptide epimerase [Elusimicrobia bacterium]|nr:dipeptide epimerase [Elusimicrobiota bacterium]
MSATTIVAVDARPLTLPMREPFEIAGGAQTRVENVVVRVRLKGGTAGFGEAAPLPAFNGETQASTLKAVRGAAPALIGEDAARPLLLARKIEERLGRLGAARAGLEMASLDAWSRRARFPLWAYFGGAETRLATDVTVAIVPPHEAARAARRIRRLGVKTIKIKIGRDPDDDVARVLAVSRAAPKARLLLDANQGYTAAQALAVLRALSRWGVKPALFEQPVAKDDWDGMARVDREGGVPVAADESVSGREDAWRLARVRAASVVNVKLMKYGIAEAAEVAAIARAAGLGLMIGAMIESSLGLGCAAHLAAGLGGFAFVDLDTALWFTRDPMRGLKLGPGGTYDLSAVKAGVGVAPSWRDGQ